MKSFTARELVTSENVLKVSHFVDCRNTPLTKSSGKQPTTAWCCKCLGAQKDKRAVRKMCENIYLIVSKSLTAERVSV